MGLLRLLFALSVVIGHAGLLFNYNIANSRIAVLSFFIISGFYMALILDKKYNNKSTFLFLSNRFLRIFPLYWIILLIIFTLTLLKFLFHLGTADNAIIHYINWSPHTSQFIFGLDLFNFIMRNITLIFTFDYFIVNNNTPGYLMIQQAWSLQIELLFYLLAPFLTRFPTKSLLVFTFLYLFLFFGFVIPFHLFQYNLIYFWISYLVYFLAGIMSYRFLHKRLLIIKPHPYFVQIISILFISYLLLYNFFPFKFSFPLIHDSDLPYYAMLAISLPFIFLQTSSSIIDAFIGKLSYPIYVSHILIIKLISNIPLFHNESNLKTVIVIVFTILLSFFMVKLIESPINRFRQARVKSL